jgi:outer membrane protein assembly factor BamB
MKRLALAVIVLGACGGGQTHPNLFSTNWTDDGGASIAAVQQKMGAAKPAIGADVAVGVGGNSDKVLGIPLSGGTAWTFAHAVDVRPTVAGSVVVGEGGGELFCLDAASGRKLWARQVGPMKMRGAGDDGKTTVITLAQHEEPGSVLLAVERDGSVARQIETDKALGVPAVLGGYAFVPWSYQYVSVLDLTSGDEAARFVIRGKVSHAFAQSGWLFFGEQDLFRFDDKIRNASRNMATRFTLPQRELPGVPSLMAPGDQPLGPVANAYDKTRMYVHPKGDAVGFDADRFYGTYFRLAMAFDAKTTKLAWVHDLPVDLVGAAAGPSSFVLCDQSGKVLVLDAATGGVERELSLGGPVKSCTVQADGLASAQAQPPPPLSEQIGAALTNRDSEMVSGQRLLLRELATLPDESVTKTLVDLASNPLTAPLLIADARRALAARRNGAAYMRSALARHYDFLHDVLLTPPVGPMAQALAAMKDKQSAPLLAAHLLDPADTDDDVKQAAAALVEIGDAAEVPALEHFLTLYHAAADSQDVADAAVSAGQALLAYGGPAGRKAVDAALGDPMTLEVVKERLSAVEQQADAKKGAPPKSPKPPKKK